MLLFFFFSSRRRHTRFKCDWSSDVCSSDLGDDVVASEVAERGPGADPQHGAERVEGHETQPVHLGQPSDDSVRLAQTLDEAGDDHDLAAKAGEESLRLLETFAGEPDVLAEAQDERAAADPADRAADVVPYDRREHRDHTNRHDLG